MKRLKLLLIESGAEHSGSEQSLNLTGFSMSKALYSPAFLTSVKENLPDVIVIHIDFPSDKLIADIQRLEQEAPVAIILFTQDRHLDMINRAINADVAAYVTDGFRPENLGSIIHVALARFKRQQMLKSALEEACAKLEDRKQIDRAKAILIKTQRFSEDEAYHTLRKLAMDRNVTLGEMAKNVIAMAELLK